MDNNHPRQVCKSEVVKISGYATVAILRTNMESLLETGHGKILDSVKKSYKNVNCEH